MFKSVICCIAVFVMVGAIVSTTRAQQTVTKSEQKPLALKCTPRLIKQPAHSYDNEQALIKKGERATGYSPLVTFEIQESGEVTNAVLKRSSGYSRIDRGALAWVKGTKYNRRPGCGVIETSMTVDIHFGPAASNER
ncbi:MAG: energy transducer TonB family protein [Candidatus Dormibacteraceae bacterium]